MMIKLIWGIIRSRKRKHLISVNYQADDGLWMTLGKVDCQGYEMLGVIREILSHASEEVRNVIVEDLRNKK